MSAMQSWFGMAVIISGMFIGVFLVTQKS